MCGIVGCWQKDDTKVDSEMIVKMRDTMVTRGPDDEGIWVNGAIGLGHRRLSILDLSSKGHQPMASECGRFIIVYNGEVYNFREIRSELMSSGYRFQSNSDTEVVLKAYMHWGEKSVDRFVGMFAFGIWDVEKQCFFLARDRMGIKPLYYYMGNKVVLFASRISALLTHADCPKDIDIDALGLYLQIGFVAAPWSIIKGVKKLQPGHYAWIDMEGVREHCYWSINTITIDNSLNRTSEDENVERLDFLLREAVKLRLISDVPLGAFLSGGIDSSVVTAIMCQLSSKSPKTFTIGLKDSRYDESGYAMEISKHLGTDHYEYIIDSSDLLQLLDDNTIHYDEPFADFSSLPAMMVSRLSRKQVTVCLSGDGGDELFAGYHYYSILSKLQYLYYLPPFLRKTSGRIISLVKNHNFSLLGQSLCQANVIESFAFMRSMIKDYGQETILEGETLSIKDLFTQRSKLFSQLDDVSRVCRLDAAYYLADDILQKVDVASMSVGLEARVPILDHRVVEFAMSLPMKHKLHRGQSKYLLKKVLSRCVPPRLFERPKGGFTLPLREWFRGELKEMIQDELSPSRVRDFGYLKPEGVKRLLDLHLSGQRETHPMLWLLMSLLRWNEQVRLKYI